MFLATTIKSGLVSAYGGEGCQTVLGKLDQYLTVVSGVTPNAAAAVLDDAASMDRFGLPPQPVGDPSSITAGLRRLSTSARLPEPISEILIFGGDEVFPFWRVVNPVEDRNADPDPQVLTDNVYAALGSNSQDDWLNPPIAIGRICPGRGASANEFSDVLDLLIRNRQNRPPRSGSCAFSNRSWEKASQTAAARLTEPVHWLLSPDDCVTPGNATQLNCRFLYCNLHGFENDPAWKGYNTLLDQFVVALTPDAVSRDYVAGATVFSEACYGLDVAGKSTANSCALKFIAEGAAAVVGATGLAFGSFSEWQTNLLNADRLASGFFEAASQGQTAGGCLRAARSALMGSTSTALNTFEKKTLLQFCLLGDPSLA